MAGITISIDGQDVAAKEGQTIMEAADKAGIYIPRLCFHDDLPPGGHCRICSVKVNGKVTNACTFPASNGSIIENDTAEMNTHRRTILEMLFVEGNHFCPFCEKSGNCELQSLAARMGMTAPTIPYMFKNPAVDASHPDVFIDRNRCVICGRCVRSSRDTDQKVVFGFRGRGINKQVAVDAAAGLGGTGMDKADAAAKICPTGCLMVKRVGFSDPYGTRKYDKEPIGSNIERKGS